MSGYFENKAHERIEGMEKVIQALLNLLTKS